MYSISLKKFAKRYLSEAVSPLNGEKLNSQIDRRHGKRLETPQSASGEKSRTTGIIARVNHPKSFAPAENGPLHTER